jgi:hypothetical protein
MYRINPIRKNPHCNSKLLNPFLTLKPTPKSTSKDYKTTTESQTKYQQSTTLLKCKRFSLWFTALSLSFNPWTIWWFFSEMNFFKGSTSSRVPDIVDTPDLQEECWPKNVSTCPPTDIVHAFTNSLLVYTDLKDALMCWVLANRYQKCLYCSIVRQVCLTNVRHFESAKYSLSTDFSSLESIGSKISVPMFQLLRDLSSKDPCQSSSFSTNYHAAHLCTATDFHPH